MTIQSTITKPDAAEYADYYGKYVALVPGDAEILSVLHRQLDETLELLRGIPEANGDTRYAPDKWSIKEVIGHVADTERIFAYRALRFARGDATPLPGFEQNDYVVNARFDDCLLPNLPPNLNTSGAPLSRCLCNSHPKHGNAQASPAAIRSAFAHWLTSSPGMNFITEISCCLSICKTLYMSVATKTIKLFSPR